MHELRPPFDNCRGWPAVFTTIVRASGVVAATSLTVMSATENPGAAAAATAQGVVGVPARSSPDRLIEGPANGHHLATRGECDLYRNMLRNSSQQEPRAFGPQPMPSRRAESSETDAQAVSLSRAVPFPRDTDRPEARGSGEPQLFVEAIIQHPGLLSIGGVDSLAAGLADAIRQRISPTEIPRVDVLTVEVAAMLADQGGVRATVWFESIGRIEPGAIEALLTMRPTASKAKPGAPKPAAAIILPVELKSHLTVEQIQAVEAHKNIHFGRQPGL